MKKFAEAKYQHAAYYSDRLLDLQNKFSMGTINSISILKELDADFSQINIAQQWAAQNLSYDQKAANLCIIFLSGIKRFMDARFSFSEKLAWIEPAITVTKLIDDKNTCCDFLWILGTTYLENNFKDLGEKVIMNLVSEAEKSNSSQAEAKALFGLALLNADNKTVMSDYLMKSLRIAEGTGENELIAKLYISICDSKSSYNEYLPYLEKAYEIGRTTGDVFFLCKLFLSIGKLYSKENPASALLFSYKSLEIAKTLNMKNFQYANHLCMAEVYKEEINLSRVDYHLARANILLSELDNPVELAHLFMKRGIILRSLGKCEEAIPLFVDAVNSFFNLHDREFSLQAIGELAATLMMINNSEEAANYLFDLFKKFVLVFGGNKPNPEDYKRLKKIIDKHKISARISGKLTAKGFPILQAISKGIHPVENPLALSQPALGSFDLFEERYLRVSRAEYRLETANMLGNREEIYNSYMELGNAYYEINLNKKAIDIYLLCYEGMKYYLDKKFLSRIFKECGFICISTEENKEALVYFEKSESFFQLDDENEEKINLMVYKADALWKSGQHDLAGEILFYAWEKSHSSLCRSISNLIDLRLFVTMGMVSRALGRLDTSIKLYQMGIDEAIKRNDRRMQSLLLGELGWANYEFGNSEKALSHLKEQLRICNTFTDKHDEIQVLFRLGAIYLANSDKPSSMQFLSRAKELSLETGIPINFLFSSLMPENIGIYWVLKAGVKLDRMAARYLPKLNRKHLANI